MEVILLSSIGVLVGLLSGFMGIGGGILLTPLLLLLDYTFKSAIGIAVFQMFLASVYGTYLHFKKYDDILKVLAIIGVGGFIGGNLGAYSIMFIPTIYLKMLFMGILLYSIYSLITKRENNDDQKLPQREIKSIFIYLIIFFFGMFVGALGASIGVGGGLLIIPFAHLYLRYDLKKSSTLSLAFIMFGSLGGVISHYQIGNIELYEASIITIGSLVGVYVGLKLKDIVHIDSYKNYLLILNIIILCIISYKTFYN